MFNSCKNLQEHPSACVEPAADMVQLDDEAYSSIRKPLYDRLKDKRLSWADEHDLG